MDPKKLKKLADACRKAGIKHYRDADFEFTLSEDAPQPRTRRSSKAPTQAKSYSSPDQDFQSEEEMTQEKLLFWSAAPGGVQLSEDEAG